MSRQRPRSLPQSSGSPVCCFCGFSEDNELEYGKLLTEHGIVTHYYCLLLSSNMEQNGNDDEGILGFMLSDIQKELRRGKRLSCVYCRKTGATLGCCNTRCKRVFHLPCGLQAGSLHQFFGEFRSFCIRHRSKQQIDDHIKQEATAAGAVTCYICYEEVNPQNTVRSLWAPCCRKNAWFHRKCVQHLALSAGYFFKCPLCNNKQEFQEAMQEHGIYIPDQDASWELVPNAFHELLHRHNRCDADKCLCPKGRTHTGVNAKWELVLCRLCGSQGIHKACGHLKWASSAWECAECTSMLYKADKPSSLPITGEIVEVTNEIPEEDSSSDSEISVGRNPSPLSIIERQDSPPPITSPLKLRPGPRSYKLQQVVLSAQSMEATTIGTSNTSLPTSVDISSYIGSESSSNASGNESCDDQLLQVKNLPVGKSSLSTENTSPKAGSTNFCNNSILPESMAVQLGNTSTKTDITTPFLKSNASPERIQEKLKDPNCRIAEVIVIDSDDEVEIISEQPKNNVLTTKDGIKIEIHNLPKITAESQKAEGDTKIGESRHFEKSEPLYSRCQKNAAPDSSNHATSTTPTSTLAPTKKSNASTNTIIITENAVPDVNNQDLILMNEYSKNEPMMNLKITNVTSLRLEDFANTSQELVRLQNVNSGIITTTRDVRSGLFLQDQQQLQVVEMGNPTIKQKPDTNLVQLNIDRLKESNVKRKSDERTVEKIVSNLSDHSVIIEQYKRARICESENHSTLLQNANISWNTNLNDLSEAVPIFVTSIPITCPENNNELLQSTKTLQKNLNESQSSSSNNEIRLIHNTDIRRINGSCKLPSETILMSSIQAKTNNDANHGFVSNNKNIQVKAYGDSTYLPKASKARIPVQPQLTIQNSTQNATASNTDIHSITQSNLQHSLNLQEDSSPLVEPQTSPQLVPNCSERVPFTPHEVYQAPDNVKRDIKRQNKNKHTSRTSFPLPNGAPKNCTNTPASSNEDQPDLNNVPQTDNLVSQLSNGFPITSVCDGDAGSSPAAEVGFTHQAASEFPFDSTAEPVISKFRPESATKEGAGAADNTSVSTRIPAIPVPQTSLSTTGKYCDRPRLIPKKVPLRNLKFRVLDSNIVQMLIHDTVNVNININAGNQQNNCHGTKLKSLIEKKRSRLSPRGCPESGSLEFCRDKKNDDTGITEECDSVLSNPMKCLKSRAVSLEKLESSRGSLNNCTISERWLHIDVVQGAATAIINSKIKALCSSEENCSSEKKSSDDNYYSDKKENKPLVFACFKNDEKNYLYAQQESKNWYFKRSRNKGENAVAVEKRRCFSEKLTKTLVKMVNDTSDTQRLSLSKSLIGLNGVSKRLLKDNHNSSDSKLPINCYNNFKKVTDANLQDSKKSNCNNIADVRLDENNTVLDNLDTVKSDKRRDNSRSNNSKAQAVNTNHNSNISHVINCKSMNRDIARDTCVKTEKRSAALKDRIGSHEGANVSNHEFNISEQLHIKVKIDLEKIQSFINNKPQLFKKRSLAKSKQDEDALPSLYKLNSHRSSLDRTTQTTDSVNNVTNTHVKKKFKYDSNLFKDHSES